MMDEIAEYNQSKWDDLAGQGILYSRPLLDLTPESAREWLDPAGFLGDMNGRKVLCLASGGGKQTAAFAVLGARVSVIDLSAAMLARDQLAAQHYNFPIEAHHGDMRDLSVFPSQAFDVVWQPYSLNYVPDPLPVFRQVSRVIKPGGSYVLQLANPFTLGLFETDWDGKGYPIHLSYENSAEIPNPVWEFDDGQGNNIRTDGPRTFRHTLSGVFNALAGLGFRLERMVEEVSGDRDAAPGSWEHYTNTIPPWFTILFVYSP
jgi:SAM-dependent methyltransferase